MLRNSAGNSDQQLPTLSNEGEMENGWLAILGLVFEPDGDQGVSTDLDMVVTSFMARGLES
jgi:hypothetical protein